MYHGHGASAKDRKIVCWNTMIDSGKSNVALSHHISIYIQTVIFGKMALIIRDLESVL
jgi:hypothetical protein